MGLIAYPFQIFNGDYNIESRYVINTVCMVLSFQIRLQAVARLLSPVEISTSSMWGSSRVQGNAAVHLKLQSICYIPQESSKFISSQTTEHLSHDM